MKSSFLSVVAAGTLAASAATARDAAVEATIRQMEDGFNKSDIAAQEAGYTAFVLVKAGPAWKVESWSWASPAAVPAK